MWQQVEEALRESTRSVLLKLVIFLPGLLALFLAVALMAVLGTLLAFLLRRGLIAAKFDERFAHSQNANVADWAPSHSPTVLAGRVVFWGCILFGVIVGISAFDTIFNPGTSEISLILIPYFTHAVGAILILLAGTIVARFLSRSVLISAVNLQLQYARFLSLGVKWLVLVLTAAMVLEHLQIGGTIVALAFGILFGGIVLTLALAVGLGSRDLVSRSLEKTSEREPRNNSRLHEFDETQPPAKPTGTLRHF